jgi:serine O-acetyltransferase
MQALKADTFRVYGRFGWGLVAKGMVSNPAFCVVATLRFCQFAHLQPGPLRTVLLLPAKVMHKLACLVAGIELPWRTAIGPGFALTHGRGIVVNVKTRIGTNVTLFQGVTLGQRDSIASDGTRTMRFPVVGDDVWIGPNAIVVGITIGKGSRIAGGAYVYEDVPPECIVLGNPGKIVKTQCRPDVPNRWES